MPNSITNRQLFFILYLTITAYSMIDLPKNMAQTAGKNSWIAIILTSIVFAFAIIIIAKLNNMFQGQVFFDYSQEIVGKFFAYALGIYFVINFLFVAVYLKIKISGLIKSNFLPKTPSVVVLIAGIILFAFVAYKGITNVARLFEIYGLLVLIVILLLSILMLTQGMSFNVMPLFIKYEVKGFPDAFRYLIPAFSGIEILLIIPFTAKNKKAPKVAFFSVLAIGLIYVLIVESTIKILGLNNTRCLNDSFIEAMRLIEMPLIERADIFYLTFGLAGLFSGMIIVFTGIVEFSCKIFSKAKRIVIVIIVAILLFVLSLCAMKINIIGDIYKKIWIYMVICSGIFIPSIVFIIAKIRKYPRKDNDGGIYFENF